MLVWRYWFAMVLAIALTAGCRVDSGEAPAPAAQFTVPPPATATPAPTATPTPAPTPTVTPTAAPPAPATPAPTATPAPSALPTLTPLAAVAPIPEPTPPPVPTPTFTPPRTNVLSKPALDPKFCAPDGYCGSFALGGRLTAATWLDADRMYLADFDGNIRLLNVATGATEIVRSGLTIPRGLTVLDGSLYVSDLGNLCAVIEELPVTDAEISWCRLLGPDRERFLGVLKRVNARIMSYRIDQDGRLSRPQLILGGIVTTMADHGPNGLVNDGEWVYASIGVPVVYTQEYREIVPELANSGVRIELLGAIVRFRPGAADNDAATDTDVDVEIWATGLRNTYGISIAPDGTIYGADNDDQGGLADCCHREELNAIVPGGYYGFPDWGTNLAPPEANVIEPVAVLPGTASTFAHASADGVYVAYLALDSTNDGFVVDRFDYATWQSERVFKDRTHTTALLERNGLLYIITFDGYVHLINPKTAAVDITTKGSPFHNDKYVAQGIAAAGPPAVPPGYAVYLDAGRLIYAKTPCAPADREPRFFLHLVPENLDNIPRGRRQHGYDNLDFDFADYGWQSGAACYAVRELPSYTISAIRTGQYIPDGPRTWAVELPVAP